MSKLAFKVLQLWRGSGGNVRLSHLLMIFLHYITSIVRM